MQTERRLADLPLALLLLLGAGFAAGLGSLLARHSLPADPFESCVTAASTLYAQLMTVGTIAPAGILSVVVLAGTLALAHQLWATDRMLRKVLASAAGSTPRLIRLAALADLAGRVDMVRDRGVFVFCYGLIRPRVCVSAALVDLLSDDELVTVLRHEAHHVRHLDPMKILVGRSVASALFFLPLAGGLRNGYLAGKEICADRAAQAGSDGAALARALMKMLCADRPTWPAGVLAIGAMTPTEARIRHILEPEEAGRTLPPAIDWVVTAALVAGIFGFSHGSAAAAHGSSSQDASCLTMAVTEAPALDGRARAAP